MILQDFIRTSNSSKTGTYEGLSRWCESLPRASPYSFRCSQGSLELTKVVSAGIPSQSAKRRILGWGVGGEREREESDGDSLMVN